jgi:hypothetical protein
MTDGFIQRLQAEEQDLKAKIDKLEGFFSTETFQGLEDRLQKLLRVQYDAMIVYWQSLLARLDIHGEANVATAAE